MLYDDFYNLNNWIDGSKLINWSKDKNDISAFSVANKTISIKNEALGKNRYYSFIDYRFPTEILHNSKIINITFTAKWQSDKIPNGERNLLRIIFLHDYPLTSETDKASKINILNMFGRPAYSMTIRGKPNSAYLQYGGGYVENGIFSHTIRWLPGLFEAAGGGHPAHPYFLGNKTTPNQMGSSGWVETYHRWLSSTKWQKFNYVLYPDRQEVYVNNKLELKQLLPLTKPILSISKDEYYLDSYPNYFYFNNLVGVRIYWGNNDLKANVEIDNFKIEVYNP